MHTLISIFQKLCYVNNFYKSKSVLIFIGSWIFRSFFLHEHRNVSLFKCIIYVLHPSYQCRILNSSNAIYGCPLLGSSSAVHAQELLGFSTCQPQVVCCIFPQFNAFLSTWKKTASYRIGRVGGCAVQYHSNSLVAFTFGFLCARASYSNGRGGEKPLSWAWVASPKK